MKEDEATERSEKDKEEEVMDGIEKNRKRKRKRKRRRRQKWLGRIKRMKRRTRKRR
jgi:hypothetical protein